MFLSVFFFSWDGEKGHKETHVCLCWYMGDDLKVLQEEHIIRTLDLVSRRCLKSTPNPISLSSAWLHCAQVFAHVEEYVRIVCALVLSTFVASFDKFTRVLCFLHPFAEVDFFTFINNIHSKTEVTLHQKAFIFTLVHSPRFSSDGPHVWCMNFHEIIISDDSANDFNLFSKICGHITQGHVPSLILRFFSASWFLMLEKQYGGICPSSSI
jgi:hypothetical protein